MPGAKAEKLIEPLPVRMMRILRTVVPLSKCAGCVACIPEQLGDSDLVGAH